MKNYAYVDDGLYLNSNLVIKCENLYDEMKLRILKTAFDKYELEELQKILDIKNSEY